MAEKIKILIVDDHPVIGIAIDLLLKTQMRNTETELVEGGKPALRVLKEKSFDLIVLDVNLPDYNVISLIPNIFNIDPEAKILIFTMTPENILARRLFSMDVCGFLSKKVSDDEILKAVKTILAGEKYISKDFSDIVVKDFLSGKKSVNPFDDLSDREFQILTEILKGSTTKDISDRLNLHSSSISTYRIRIYEKINVENHMELYKKAQLFGIVD